MKYLITNLALQLTDTIQTAYGVFLTGKHEELNPMFTNIYNLIAIKFLVCVILILLYQKYKGKTNYKVAYTIIAIIYIIAVIGNFKVLS